MVLYWCLVGFPQHLLYRKKSNGNDNKKKSRQTRLGYFALCLPLSVAGLPVQSFLFSEAIFYIMSHGCVLVSGGFPPALLVQGRKKMGVGWHLFD